MDENIQKKFQTLYGNYAEKLPERIRGLIRTWENLQQNWNVVLLEEFHRELHGLAGSSAVYGHENLATKTRQLEFFIKALSVALAPLTSEIQATIEKYLGDISDASEFYNMPVIPEKFKVAKHADATEQKQIWLLDNDREFKNELSERMEKENAQIVVLSSVDDLSKMEKQLNGLALIINVDQLGTKDIARIVKFRQDTGAMVPLICVAENADFATRLKAVKAGSCVFFQKPVDVADLYKVLNKIYNTTANESYRVLVVDNSVSSADYYALVLQEAGMVTKVISDPLQLLTVMAEFQPDLLLVDLYMIECTGLEVEAVLRQEPLYMGVPIIFLSTADEKLEPSFALQAISDDILSKPMLPQHIVAAVRSRVQRVGVTSLFLVRDRVTKLLTQEAILEDLQIELSAAEHQEVPLSFVIINIEDFETINYKYGHLIGDNVLQKLADLLLAQLRKTDLVGRYSDKSFALVLPGAGVIESKKICQALADKFYDLQFVGDGKPFRVGLSMGIASYPRIKKVRLLVSSAENALSLSASGRNRILHIEDK